MARRLLIGNDLSSFAADDRVQQYVESRWTGWFSKLTNIIPIDPGSRQAVQAIREAREALRNGEYVCIFAEGCLSRTGHLLSFQPGLLKILKDTGVR